jgi:hypothetical protein
MLSGEFETGASHYFFNDSLLSNRFHHFRRGFWGLAWPFGGSGRVGPFGASVIDSRFGALGFEWPFDALDVDWPLDVLGGLRPRDFGIGYSGQVTRLTVLHTDFRSNQGLAVGAERRQCSRMWVGMRQANKC